MFSEVAIVIILYLYMFTILNGLTHFILRLASLNVICLSYWFNPLHTGQVFLEFIQKSLAGLTNPFHTGSSFLNMFNNSRAVLTLSCLY